MIDFNLYCRFDRRTKLTNTEHHIRNDVTLCTEPTALECIVQEELLQQNIAHSSSHRNIRDSINIG